MGITAVFRVGLGTPPVCHPRNLGGWRRRSPAWAGVSFLDNEHAFSSMIMAGLLALALACYLADAILAARRLGGRSRFRTQLR